MNVLTALERAFMVQEFKPVRRKGSLRGFAKVALPSGMILNDVSVHIDSGRAWALPASKAMIDPDGNVMREASGKIRYSPIVSFATKQLRDKFSDAVIEAVRLAFPDALYD